jgi:peroxiredoxin
VPAAHELSGRPVELSALAAERPAVLFFYKADCPACRLAVHALPRLGRIPGVEVALVSQDPEDETLEFLADVGMDDVRVLVDPEPWPASDAYGVAVTPTWILLAPGGEVEAVSEGWSRADANAIALRAATLAGVAGREVSLASDGPAFRPG